MILNSSGYEVDAVPEHYLDEPPASISAVRRNLVLLRRVLKSHKTKNDLFKVCILLILRKFKYICNPSFKKK